MSQIRYIEALESTPGNITKGKIYEVIYYDKYSRIHIVNDINEISRYYYHSNFGKSKLFKDVSAQIRTSTIDLILE